MRQQLLEPVPFDQARQPIQHSIAAGSLRQQCFHKARLSRPLYRHRHLPKAKPQRITTIKLRNRPTRGEGAHRRRRLVFSHYDETKQRQRERTAAASKRTRDHFIGHLSWKLSWLSLTMVATVFSESWPSAHLTTSCR